MNPTPDEDHLPCCDLWRYCIRLWRFRGSEHTGSGFKNIRGEVFAKVHNGVKQGTTTSFARSARVVIENILGHSSVKVPQVLLGAL
jgi:hypothetical protein